MNIKIPKWLKSKTLTTPKAYYKWSNWNFHLLLAEMPNGMATLEDSLTVS
jgi:hypothetical protein